MHWADDPKAIFTRDFAYPRPPRRRLRTMTSAADIAHEPAHDYAEYVFAHSLPELSSPVDPPRHARGKSTSVDKHSRPALPDRIHSHRLRVQAHAKNMRARLLSGPLIDIIVGVGDVKRQWSLHRNLLSYHSEYLASELQTNDATKNKAGNKLELPEDDPKGFELLVKWLYQGKLDDVGDLTSAERKYDYAVACHKLYMLCERFDMPQLKNMAIDQYRKGLSQARLVPDADEINDIYQKSPEGSPFRVLMTRIAARQIMDPDADRDAESYRGCFAANPDFAIDLVNAIKSGSGGILFDDPTNGDDCMYHDHGHGPNCYGKGKGKAGNYKLVKFLDGFAMRVDG
ncbi:BTB/POZ-like protein [Macrophomina phaseolina MS6]|uniref:BTB/POZ-like protein n=1 Tax=Macrophomina phaseolina (strain MS6) TaxID=1126212 RepID=K2SB71_MACPH|nr:BTB/POZ-like protein [Macrophomina phaseolina MS6]